MVARAWDEEGGKVGSYCVMRIEGQFGMAAILEIDGCTAV